jgi:hypothetical protein
MDRPANSVIACAPARHTCQMRRVAYGSRNRFGDPLVEYRGHDVLGMELVGPDRGGNRMGCRHLHLLIDAGGADVERAAEDAGKAQHVIDLVRIVGPAGGHDGDIWLSLLGHDLGRRVRHRKHDGICGHVLQIRHAHHAWRRQSEKHVGPLQRILQRSPLVVWIGVLRIPQLHRVHLAPDSLNSIAFPSITGIAAKGPMSPRPSTAVPSDTTATVFFLIVSVKALSGSS